MLTQYYDLSYDFYFLCTQGHLLIEGKLLTQKFHFLSQDLGLKEQFVERPLMVGLKNAPIHTTKQRYSVHNKPCCLL